VRRGERGRGAEAPLRGTNVSMTKLDIVVRLVSWKNRYILWTSYFKNVRAVT
jgi:hypothetical protein